MRTLSLILALSLSAVVGSVQAREITRDRPDDTEQTRHARKVIRALDDYDAQLARRQVQLRKEQRDLERRMRSR